MRGQVLVNDKRRSAFCPRRFFVSADSGGSSSRDSLLRAKVLAAQVVTVELLVQVAALHAEKFRRALHVSTVLIELRPEEQSLAIGLELFEGRRFERVRTGTVVREGERTGEHLFDRKASEGFSVGEDVRTFDQVSKLAHISGVIEGFEQLESLGVDGALGLAFALYSEN